jgi:hypothetical protein
LETIVEIKDEKRGENWATIRVEIGIELPYEMGKLELSPRWKAAGRSLANKLNITEPLVQIDAGFRDGNVWMGRTQEFVFYFRKEKENVKENESKGKEEVDCSPAKQEV